MIDIKPSIILEDSKGNRYFFYYKDSSIYYREVSGTGEAKDTILISQANGDFAAAIDTDDTIYLTCNSKYKGILLFIYTNYGWKFEPVINQHNSSNIYIMDMIVMNSSIHIFFSKKLPIPNMHNVYHLHKNLKEQMPYMEYSWRKNSLSEIFSQNMESSYSILPSKGGIIYYASVWCDGTNYYINYYCYDDSIKSWIHKSLNISYNSQVFIKLVNHNKKINLLCFYNELKASKIHHFISKSTGSNDLDFKELSNTVIDAAGVVPLFYTDDKSIQLAWIKDHTFHQYTFDDSTAKWRKAIDLPVTSESNIQAVKIIKNSGSNSITKGYFLLDKNYNVSRPIEHAAKRISEDKPKEKLQISPPGDTNDYLKRILDEIKGLTDNVRHLNNRIDTLESSTFVQKVNEEVPVEFPAARPKTPGYDVDKPSTFRKSNFKEKFMKSIKLPNYDNLLLKQDNITTFVGKPGESKPTDNIPKETRVNAVVADSSRQANTAPESPLQNTNENKSSSDTEVPAKNSESKK